jgi:guanylate kinase
MQRVYPSCAAPLVRSVSATTRPPRPGETDGVDYHFLSEQDFQSLRERGGFVECCEVYSQGYWYGTLQSEVTSGLKSGKWVVLEIDVQGAMAVLAQFPDAMTIFLRPSSLAELERRLRGRGTETEEALQRRLAVAQRELTAAKRYQFHVINDDMDRAVHHISDLLTQAWEKSSND